MPKRRSKGDSSERPKKYQSAYLLFLKDFRKKNSDRGYDVKEMVCRGAAAWSTLSPEEKVPYDKMSQKLRETYVKKFSKYKKKQKELKKAAKDEMKLAKLREKIESRNRKFSTKQMELAYSKKGKLSKHSKKEVLQKPRRQHQKSTKRRC